MRNERRTATERGKPLVGYPELWRIRVGDYRVVYTVQDAELVVLALRVAQSQHGLSQRQRLIELVDIEGLILADPPSSSVTGLGVFA